MDAEEDDIDIYVHFFKPGGAQIYYASSMCVCIFSSAQQWHKSKPRFL
jgi:hypothetical protein